MRSTCVVEGLRAHKLSTKNLSLVVDLIFYFFFQFQIEIVFIYSEVVVLNCLSCLHWIDRFESVLEDFTNRLAFVVSHNVPVSDLLVDRWVVD